MKDVQISASEKKIMSKICSLKLICIVADVHNLENSEKRYDTMKIFKIWYS